MTRTAKHYTGKNVVEEAIERIRHTALLFDHIFVMFNGSVDSLAVAELTREAGITLACIYRDEEIVTPQVVDYIHELGNACVLHWYAVPFHAQQKILGVSHSYIQFQPGREWVRAIPHEAHIDDAGRVFTQASFEAWLGCRYGGKVALLNGIRADEGIVRFRSSVNKLNESYATRCEASAAVYNVRPIFDWSKDDVLAYLHQRKAKICPIYDLQLWAGVRPSVSIDLRCLRQLSPLMYERVAEIFPEWEIEMIFGDQLDREMVLRQYAQSPETIRQWIEENISVARQQKLALKRLEMAMRLHMRNPKAYPLAYILRYFMRGAYQNNIAPLERTNTL